MTKKDLEEKIEEIVKEHEEHKPIYTCRLQIVNELVSLYQQYAEEIIGEDEHNPISSAIDAAYIRDQLRAEQRERNK